MSTSLRRLVCANFRATQIAAWLSMWSAVGCCEGACRSWRRPRSQLVCCVAHVAARYSASHVERATVAWRADVQEIGEEFMVWTIPETERLSLAFAKSASAYGISSMVGEAG